MTAPSHAIVFAASEEFAELDESWPYLQDALISMGVDPSVAFWDDPSVSWNSYHVVVPLFVWGFVTRRSEFLAWAEEMATSARLVNPAPALGWNSDEKYLAELAADGFPTVPTEFVPPGAAWLPPSEDFVIKPSVGSGGIGAARYRTLAPAHADRHVQLLHEEGHTVIFQPYQAMVDGGGETALVFLGGTYSHAINKAALLQADVGMTAQLWEKEVISSVEPRDDQRALGDAVVKSVHERFGPTGYGRVDLVDGSDGLPLVLELELVEPSLFLNHMPGAALHFATYLQGLTENWHQ